MEKASLQKLNQLREARKAAIVLTDLASGEAEILEEDDTRKGELGDAIKKAFRTGKALTIADGDQEHFINPHLPPLRLVVIGAAHISQALAPIAKITGYDMEVIDPRTAFATPERFEGTQVFADWPEDVFNSRPLDSYCALAAVTHDPKIDDFALMAALKAECFYVGALGSRKTHAKRVERFKENGLTTSEIERIRAPIGLDIAAASPQEIAVAIMGEIIQAFRTRGS